MYTQLPQGDPDYIGVLQLANSKVMPIAGSKNSITHEFEDGRFKVLNLSASKFDVEIQFEYISDSDRNEINDFYYASNKANGGQNTFLWKPPHETIAYVARFLTPLRNVYKPGSLQSVDVLKLRVSAYYGPVP